MAIKGKNLTEGSMVRVLFALAAPIVFSNVLQAGYQLTDTFWVGRLGASAVAAVSLSFPLIFLIISLGGGLSIAGTILVAQYKGKQNQSAINHISGQTLIMMLIVSVISSVIGYFLSPALIGSMGVEKDVFSAAVSYLQISFLGIVFVFGYFVFQSLMRGIGDVKTPMYIVLGTVILNLFLDPLFIFGKGPIPAFGVAGAAIATIFTQGIAVLIGLWMLFSGRYGIVLELKNVLRLDTTLIKKMFKLGFPASIEQSTRALGILFITFLVASFGTQALAAYGIGSRILSLVIIPALGFSMATATLVGQNIGAEKIERAEITSKISASIAFIVLTAIGILIFLFAAQLSTFFIPDSPNVAAESTIFIKIMAFTFGFIGIQQVLSGTFRGAGNTLTAMIIAIFSLWVFRLPLAYFLSHFTPLSVKGIWWAFPAANVLSAAASSFWFLKGTWKNKKLTKEFQVKERILEETIADEVE